MVGSQAKNEYGIGLTVVEAIWLEDVLARMPIALVDRRDAIQLRLRALIKRFG